MCISDACREKEVTKETARIRNFGARMSVDMTVFYVFERSIELLVCVA